MSWKNVGNWLKNNGKGILGVAGAVMSGGTSTGIAAIASMVAEATGEHDEVKALQALHNSPDCMVKLEEICAKKEHGIRKHHERTLELQLEDKQLEHEQQQNTIRSGDNATDEYVRRTRPQMAKQSWWATIGYVIGFELLKAIDVGSGASMEFAMILIAPAGAYMGFRTLDKASKAKYGKGLQELITKRKP